MDDHVLRYAAVEESALVAHGHLYRKQGRNGRTTRTYLPIGRCGWLRLEAVLSLIWRWRGVLEGELAEALGGWFPHRRAR